MSTTTLAVYQKARSHGGALPALLVMAGVGLSALFGLSTATSVWSFPRFLLAVALLLYVPGNVLLDLSRLRLQPLEKLTLSLVLGMLASSVVYWISAAFDLRSAAFVWPAAAVALYLYRHSRALRLNGLSRPKLAAPHLLLIGLIVLGLFPLIVLPFYYRDFALLPEGGMTFSNFPDAIFHASIANELTHSIPPQLPTLAGTPLRYHYGMDLVVAMFGSTAGLSTLDLTARFIPALFLIMAMLVVYCLGEAWFRARYPAVLLAFLVIFGEDLSFVPGLVVGSSADWSTRFFQVPTTYSLYTVNPMLPALGILFAALLCLVRYWQDGARGWLVLTAFFFAMLMEYKIFATAHAVAALAIAGGLSAWLHRDARLLVVLALTAVFAAPLALHAWLGSGFGAGMWVRLDPSIRMAPSLYERPLSDTGLGQHVRAFRAGRGALSSQAVGAFLVLLVPLPGYLIGAFGARLLAVPSLVRALFHPRSTTALRLFLAVFVLLGPIITFSFVVTPRDFPRAYNNSVWFFVESKYVAWIFAVEGLLALWRGRSRLVQILLVATVVALSVPSTIQHFERSIAFTTTSVGTGNSPQPALRADELAVIRFLDERCARGEVVLASPRLSRAVVAMTKCRVPLGVELFGMSFMSRPDLEQRSADGESFWKALRQGVLRSEILDLYQVAYLVVDKTEHGVAPVRAPGTDQSALDPVVLGARFENARFAVYQWPAD